jgi:lysophospholipase L1-like esterase
MSHSFSRYVALGDSISIDLYPALDAQTRGLGDSNLVGLGAASLLFANRDDVWPDFAGCGLTSHYAGIEKHDGTEDGATSQSVLDDQLAQLPQDNGGDALITLTVGGNDLLTLIDGDEDEREPGTRQAIANVGTILKALRSHFARATILVGTVYDPTDGTADLGDGVTRDKDWELLGIFNEAITNLAAAHKCLVADLHGEFFGHGLTEPEPADRWYWDLAIIEPNARGASEVRRVWLECLGLPTPTG